MYNFIFMYRDILYFLVKKGGLMEKLMTASEFFSEMKNALMSFNGISDTLDILFVALIIYGAIVLIRDTKAIQLAKGFILIFIIYAVVSLLKMQASSYLFSLFFPNLLLILVVIFSPEIRHAIESVGRSSLNNIIKGNDKTKKYEPVSRMINSVCRSCADMSDDKVGALIVFERGSLLGQIIDTGTRIDAEPSVEMIENIFFPKAPLHDGAMIIKDRRICAAGCILPLTANTNINSSLGTRHRAAIGMSEQSDALIVVVSEETGIISVAEKGNLKRNLSDGDLRELLTKTFIPEDNDEKGFLKTIKKGRHKQ